MHKLPGLIPLVVALFALSLVFALLERVAGALPSKRLLRRERAVDFAYWFFTPWVSKTAGLAAAFLSIGAVAAIVRFAGGSQPSPAWFEHQHVALQIAGLLVIGDLLGYASHRFFHSRFLWKFHAIHHSAEDVDWLAATRLHPVNEIGSRIAPRGVQPRQFGVIGENVPSTLLGQLAYPFRRRARVTTSVAVDVPQC